MLRLSSNLLQCFICFLLLWLAIVYSFPTTEQSRRYERDTSENEFTVGELDLVLKPGDDFLKFQICCPNGGCDQGSFLFCFSTTKQKQGPRILYGCGAGTCAYNVDYLGNDGYSLSENTFSSSDKCFDGKITMNHMHLSYTNQTYQTITLPGCPLNIVQPGNRLMLDVKTIPTGVTVIATNAQKYVEPTTTLPPSTSPPTTKPTKETTAEVPSAAKKDETEMSDALKYSLIGVGIFVFILIVGGIGFAIYWFCFKSKKSSKPALPVTVAKTAATPVIKEAPVMKEKPTEVKPVEPKKKAEKEVEDLKLAPSNVVPSSATPEPPQQPPTEPTASKAPSAVPLKPEHPKSSLPGPSLEPSSIINPPLRVRQPQAQSELPPATPTIADLIGRVGGRKYFDTFDRIQTPHYENIFDSMIRNGWITEDQALKVKKEKFIRPPSEEELRLFAAPISVMYQLLEEMINDAAYYHKPHEGAPCILAENEYHTYFVSLYAVVAHYSKYFKVGKEVPLEKCSVPLLLGIAMDRTQSEALRRRALVIMIKAVDITKIFNEAQCIKFPYPMCVICLSYQLDRYLVDNVDRLHTFSSPNNSECSRSDDGQKPGGGAAQSVAAANGSRRATDGGKQSSSSSKIGTKTSVSKEVVAPTVEKKKKMKKKGEGKKALK